MKKISLLLPLLSLTLSLPCTALVPTALKPSQSLVTPTTKSEEGEIASFTPPKNWRLADASSRFPSVKIMVIGKGQNPYPPSMNLSTQPYKGTLKQYLKTIKMKNEAQGYEWKDLGKIETNAGPASLSQVDTPSEWGNVRMMHVILLKNEKIYILTSSALREEFSKFYKDFFNAMKSLTLNKNFIETVPPARQAELKLAYNKVNEQWKEWIAQNKAESISSQEKTKTQLFNTESFQNNAWIPYKNVLLTKFADMGNEWQAVALEKTQEDLLNL